VFKAEFPEGLEDRHSTCVVRLEADNQDLKSFTTIAAIQQIAATLIPEIVPRTLQVGKVENAHGRMFNFSVIELVEGDLLQDVWHQMSAENQRSVVAELVKALDKLHSIRFSDKRVGEILDKALCEEGDEVLESFEEQPHVFGGPHTGYLNNGAALLHSIMERRKLKKPFCTMELIAKSKDIKIQSCFEELGSMVINNTDIDKWPEEVIFCHNDLTPRNFILRLCSSSDGTFKYKLAGIIDWELAGFYPASYEPQPARYVLGRRQSTCIILHAIERKYEGVSTAICIADCAPASYGAYI